MQDVSKAARLRAEDGEPTEHVDDSRPTWGSEAIVARLQERRLRLGVRAGDVLGDSVADVVLRRAVQVGRVEEVVPPSTPSVINIPPSSTSST